MPNVFSFQKANERTKAQSSRQDAECVCVCVGGGGGREREMGGGGKVLHAYPHSLTREGRRISLVRRAQEVCVKVKVDVLGSPSLIVRAVSVAVKQH